MSSVTAMYLQFGCSNGEERVNEINAWLEVDLKQYGSSLGPHCVDMTQCCLPSTNHRHSDQPSTGGTKHPQLIMLGAGLNYWPTEGIEKFWEWMKTLDWYCEGNVVMITSFEGSDESKVWRLDQ